MSITLEAYNVSVKQVRVVVLTCNIALDDNCQVDNYRQDQRLPVFDLQRCVPL